MYVTPNGVNENNFVEMVAAIRGLWEFMEHVNALLQ